MPWAEHSLRAFGFSLGAWPCGIGQAWGRAVGTLGIAPSIPYLRRPGAQPSYGVHLPPPPPCRRPSTPTPTLTPAPAPSQPSPTGPRALSTSAQPPPRLHCAALCRAALRCAVRRRRRSAADLEALLAEAEEGVSRLRRRAMERRVEEAKAR